MKENCQLESDLHLGKVGVGRGVQGCLEVRVMRSDEGWWSVEHMGVVVGEQDVVLGG